MARFTKGELEVMRILWEHGEMKPAEIQKQFPRKIKNPALRSYLTILVEKGHVTRRKVGKAYFYRARTRRESAFRSMLRSLIDTFCDGSPEALLARLIQSAEISEGELLEIKRLVDDAEASGDGREGKNRP